MCKQMKICIDATCETVWHNTPKEVKRCKDCGTELIEISLKTYLDRFITYVWQFDYRNNQRLRPTV